MPGKETDKRIENWSESGEGSKTSYNRFSMEAEENMHIVACQFRGRPKMLGVSSSSAMICKRLWVCRIDDLVLTNSSWRCIGHQAYISALASAHRESRFAKPQACPSGRGERLALSIVIRVFSFACWHRGPYAAVACQIPAALCHPCWAL